MIALDLLKARLTPGTVIVFDDYHGFLGFSRRPVKAGRSSSRGNGWRIAIWRSTGTRSR